ncbi:MAG: hypothetical protein M1839_008394 [Geoglossum umbratile]|nr:MAG: hypothetical protein M1839_008394 [Geoglossum umbratile]
MSAPITCHVLDTTTGRPATNLAVSLKLLHPAGASWVHRFSGTTDADGRVQAWSPVESERPLAEVLALLGTNGETMVWAMNFDTTGYFAHVETFYPEIEVRFFVGENDHRCHVPLLLSPYGYTTYRGS